MNTALAPAHVRGKLTPNAPLAPLVWFKSGGAAETLFEPHDVADLQAFMRDTDPAIPVWPLGLGSNLIVRDGGVPGVTVRLGKRFAAVQQRDPVTLWCGGGASGILVSSTARDAGISGLEFLRGIPGTVGGFVRMNGGAYGCEVADILIDCDVVLRSGEFVTLAPGALGYTYRHSALPQGAVVVAARLRGAPGDPSVIGTEMDRIAAEREASQPLRSRTGGSTFKNPPGQKAWALVDAASCRGLRRGDAQVSEKHCNFLLNLGSATSADIEALGEEVRERVKAHSGVNLEWEIQRVGVATPSPSGERVDSAIAERGEGPYRRTTSHVALKRARVARATMTDAETRLWSRLRDRRLAGWKFKLQLPIGDFRPDFSCAEARLIVEVDGSQHVDAVVRDDWRSGRLVREGFRVLRFWNNDVLARTDSVLDAILAAIGPHPARAMRESTFSPEGEGELQQ